MGFLNEYWLGLRGGFANDDRDAWLDDSCFFGCNFRQGVTQELYVVETDVGDETKVWTDDVGTVQTAS